MNLILFPDDAIPEEGITIDIEVYRNGSWHLHSRNRLAK